MRKTAKIVSLLIAVAILSCGLSACHKDVNSTRENDTSSSAPFTTHKFCPEDAVVNGMTLGVTTLEQAKEILGESVEIGTDEWHYGYEGTYSIMFYENGTYLSFLEFYDINGDGSERLTAVRAEESPAFTFVNGLHVGSTKDEVLATFTYEDDPAPLYFYEPVHRDESGNPIYGEPAGEYIYGDTNTTWFLETKPTGVTQSAYRETRPEEYGNAYIMTYDYCEPLDWNDDQSSFKGVCYRLLFFLDGETDTVTDISLHYLFISEYMN